MNDGDIDYQVGSILKREFSKQILNIQSAAKFLLKFLIIKFKSICEN